MRKHRGDGGLEYNYRTDLRGAVTVQLHTILDFVDTLKHQNFLMTSWHLNINCVLELSFFHHTSTELEGNLVNKMWESASYYMFLLPF